LNFGANLFGLDSEGAAMLELLIHNNKELITKSKYYVCIN